MKATQKEIDSILAQLRETLDRLLTLGEAASITQASTRPAADSWSANEILAHLRACADVWTSSIEAMLALEMPTLPEVHPRERLKQTDYPRQDFHRSLQAYARQRRRLLKILMKLSFEDWSRGAMIRRKVHTVFTRARRIAKHETEHFGQIEELLQN